MGIYDRPYYSDQPENFSWRPGATWSAINVLVAINVIVFLADLIYSGTPSVQDVLALHDSDLTNPLRWFSFLTYGFTHSSLRDPGPGIMHILMNMFVLWMFGRQVEARLGKTNFLVMYLISVVACGVLTVLWHRVWGVNSSMVGASGAVSTVLVYFCCMAPQATVILMVFPMPAWVLGVVVVGFDFIRSLGPDDHVAHETHLIGAALGAAFFFYGVPGKAWLDATNQWWRRRKLRVVRADEQRKESLAQDADRILDKVNRDGYDSLTSSEKKTLEKYSRDIRSRQ